MAGQEKGSNQNAVSAKKIGEPFHNPYTFIPFPEKIERYAPTSITADEFPDELDRHTGVLELEIKTLSPLMSCSPKDVSERRGHKTFKALTIDSDVIVPATSVRGSLRTLMTIISGGTLGYMDESLWLTQGRDAQLGPNGKMPTVPNKAFLAKVIVPGNATHIGKIELGETKLKKADDLDDSISGGCDSNRPTTGRNPQIITDNSGTWDVKLSGRPIMRRGKKEGLFKGSGIELELSKSFWETFQGRHRHSVQSELKTGDLIWLEPQELDCEKITCENDIKSIQWSRWGHHGVKLQDILPKVVLPDSIRDDAGVDMVTDLFGQIPHKCHQNAAGPFAARIRPGNLIFFNANNDNNTTKVTLAPLAAPHPGCVAFYRDQENLDIINMRSPLKGYKVYRNTQEREGNAPWKYSVQGVYDEQGKPKNTEEQRVNKTAELLNEGVTGKLKISFRALDDDELALLYTACSVDWKLGGGKPLGLGHCRVIGLKMYDEEGNVTNPMEESIEDNNLNVATDYVDLISHLNDRIELYKASQVPVKKLRYPRAVTQNRNKSSRAGLSWFARHASPKKNGNGLETLWTDGALKSDVGGTQIKAQALPNLNATDSSADLLYGYDVVELNVNTSNRNQRKVGKMETFDEDINAPATEMAGYNTSQNRKTRQSVRDQRSSNPNETGYLSLTKDNVGDVINEEFRKGKLSSVRSQEILNRLDEFGITPGQSTKWGKKFKLLRNIINK